MSGRDRQAFEILCRDLVLYIEDRMEGLRCIVERAELDGREVWERTLDALRGQWNRTLARMEAAHTSPDESWAFARAKAEQAVSELVRAIDEIDGRLQRAAA